MTTFVAKTVCAQPFRKLFAIVAVVSLLAVYSGSCRAASFVVSNLNDSGAGSLRAAITSANTSSGSTITFQSGLSGKITLASSLPTIAVSMTISGPATSSIVIDGAEKYRPIDIYGPHVVCSISNLTLQHGNDSIDQDGGGGAWIESGVMVTLTDCTITQNSPTGYAGGGIRNDGQLTVNGCSFTDNTETNSQGGGGIINTSSGTLTANNCVISDNAAYDGGAIQNLGTAYVSNSSLSGNTASVNGGGAVFANGPITLTDCTLLDNSMLANNEYPNGGAIQNNYSTVIVTDCTISNNTVSGSGGGIFNLGGTLTVTGSTVSGNQAGIGSGVWSNDTATLTNCTISGNSTTTDGGGGMENLGTASLTNCTFTLNTAHASGGAFEDGGQATLTNCILFDDAPNELNLASGSVSASFCDFDNGLPSGVTDGGHNISTAPLLDTSGLADNGGPTDTIALTKGSPCFGAGTEAGAPTIDQRGYNRPNPPSIGAYDRESLVAHRFDFNGDGDDDLLFQNSNGQTLVWDMDGKAVKSFGATFATVAPPWHVQAVGDINADGHPDLLWWNSSTGECLFWEMTGAAGTTVLQYGKSFASISDTSWRPVSMADFDGDGHPDILWENSATGQLLVWYMDGNAVKKYGSSFATLPANWTVAGTADFNQDGHPDLLLENGKTGQVLVWYLTGSTGTTILTYGKTFATNSDLNWSIVGTGDENGDGHPDLVWHDRSTGATDVWLMGGSLGTAVSSYGGNIGSVPTTWSIAGVH